MDKFDWRTGNTNPSRQKKNRLSPREIQIIQGLAQGKSRRQLAFELGLSIHTIKSYLVRIYNFLGAVSTADAYRKMIAMSAQAPTKPGCLAAPPDGDLHAGLRVRSEDD